MVITMTAPTTIWFKSDDGPYLALLSEGLAPAPSKEMEVRIEEDKIKSGDNHDVRETMLLQ